MGEVGDEWYMGPGRWQRESKDLGSSGGLFCFVSFCGVLIQKAGGSGFYPVVAIGLFCAI